MGRSKRRRASKKWKWRQVLLTCSITPRINRLAAPDRFRIPHQLEVLVGKSYICTLPFGVVLPYNSAMKNLRPLLIVLTGFACLAVCAAAQDTKQVKKTAPHLTTAISGKVLYGQYCAVCHGVDGKGAGPAASALKQRPTDLTQISRQNKSEFPEEHFLKMMNGEVATAAHGSQDMPIWGTDFINTTTNPNLAQDRIYSLMNYIEEMQAK